MSRASKAGSLHNALEHADAVADHEVEHAGVVGRAVGHRGGRGFVLDDAHEPPLGDDLLSAGVILGVVSKVLIEHGEFLELCGVWSNAHAVVASPHAPAAVFVHGWQAGLSDKDQHPKPQVPAVLLALLICWVADADIVAHHAHEVVHRKRGRGPHGRVDQQPAHVWDARGCGWRARVGKSHIEAIANIGRPARRERNARCHYTGIFAEWFIILHCLCLDYTLVTLLATTLGSWEASFALAAPSEAAMFGQACAFRSRQLAHTA